MESTIHLIRHAEGYSNLSEANRNMRDPLLTPHGEQQCKLLRSRFPDIENIDLIVTSPMKRAIWTALLVFQAVLDQSGKKITVLPELQESTNAPCDIGSSLIELQAEFEMLPVNLEYVTPGWENKTEKMCEDDAVAARARKARNWLRGQQEQVIVVVTHGNFLHYLTEDWYAHTWYGNTGWINTEYRSYTFSACPVKNAHLIEKMESQNARAVKDKPPHLEMLAQLWRA